MGNVIKLVTNQQSKESTEEHIGNGVFRTEVPDGATWVIFNNGSSGAGNQTDDLKIEGYNKIYDNGWQPYNG